MNQSTQNVNKKPRDIAVETSSRLEISLAIIGALMGLVAYFISLLFEKVILQRLFCDSDPAAFCSHITDVSSGIASIAIAFAGLIALTKLGVYRPLLVILATAVTTWGIFGWVSGMPVWAAIIASLVIFAICYVAYSWLARLRLFWLALIVTVIVVVVARIALI